MGVASSRRSRARRCSLLSAQYHQMRPPGRNGKGVATHACPSGGEAGRRRQREPRDRMWVRHASGHHSPDAEAAEDGRGNGGQKIPSRSSPGRLRNGDVGGHVNSARLERPLQHQPLRPCRSCVLSGAFASTAARFAAHMQERRQAASRAPDRAAGFARASATRLRHRMLVVRSASRRARSRKPRYLLFVHGLAARLLGTHVRGSAEQHADAGHHRRRSDGGRSGGVDASCRHRFEGLRQSEIQHLHRAIRRAA